VVRRDAPVGELERGDGLDVNGADGILELLAADAERIGRELETIELARQLDEGSIAARGDLGNDGTDRGVNRGRGLTLSRKERIKPCLEVVVRCREPLRHGLLRPTGAFRGAQDEAGSPSGCSGL
jgi:hypothetical protein